MTDRPILFSEKMVYGLTHGLKTQTRRLATSPLAKTKPRDRLWVRETWAPVSDGFVYRSDFWEHYSGPWKPSIHMPRRASRLFLVVTDVRFQALHDITEREAEAEGEEDLYDYQRLWDELYGPGSWDENPQIVALSFTVKKQNIDNLPHIICSEAPHALV